METAPTAVDTLAIEIRRLEKRVEEHLRILEEDSRFLGFWAEDLDAGGFPEEHVDKISRALRVVDALIHIVRLRRYKDILASEAGPATRAIILTKPTCPIPDKSTQ